jgi:hypothetical protein
MLKVKVNHPNQERVPTDVPDELEQKVKKV